jgi:hypothetical protein
VWESVAEGLLHAGCEDSPRVLYLAKAMHSVLAKAGRFTKSPAP